MDTKSEKGRRRLASRLARVLSCGICISQSTHAGTTSAPILNNSAHISRKSRSAPHSAGTSRALAQASIFLDGLLKCTTVSISQQRRLDRYLAVIESQGTHQIKNDEATEFEPAEEAWELISLAVKRAQKIYADEPHSAHDTILSPSGDFKKTAISDDELPNGDHAIMVTVRGSAGFNDWLVNFNGVPVQAVMGHGPPQRPRACHEGFITVANRMKESVVKAIVEKLDGMANTRRAVDLVFTGHSAGGAIATLFYAMSSLSDSPFSVVLPRFRHVHCIAFGAPPVATSSILKPQPPPFESGMFLNIVNERDPIPLAQQEYIYLLLKCFIGAQEQGEPSKEKLQVPEPVLRLSGTCIILRDVGGGIREVKWKAVEVLPGVLERKLFGDPTMHDIDNYVDRIEAARQAGCLET